MVHQVAGKLVLATKDEVIEILFFVLWNGVLILRANIIYLTPRIILTWIHSYSLIVVLKFGLSEIILKFHSECKGRALEPLTLETNRSSEFLYDLLWYNESKTDTSSIDFLGTLYEAKQFKELTLVFSLDAQSCVFDLDFNVWFAIQFVKSVIDCNTPILLCKFESIRLDVHQHLLETSLIGANHQWLVTHNASTVEGKIVIKQLALELGISIALICIGVIKVIFLLWFLNTGE